jgi:TolB-like protein/DNA-binding winged helix-turn-helix (wHTH) protein/Flp pilus assembly protein TadD
MNPEVQARRRYRFGVFQLDTSTGELYKHGMRIKLQDQPCQVLTVLLERVGEVVTREELRQRLWDHDTYVDFDHSLNISVNKLRDALGDSAANPRFIETLPRKGYRFLAAVSVEEVSDNRTAAAAAPVTSPAIADVAVPSSTGVSSQQISSPKRSTRWLGIAALVLVAVGIGSYFWWKQETAARGIKTGRVMLAVLPFEDLTGDKGNDFFVAGLHDELIAQLGRLHPSRLGVIARTSSVQYAGARKSIDQIGHELHVDYVLDGTIRSISGKFRVTAELIQVSDQTHLWVETYEPAMGDILMLQEDVARRVSQVLSMEFLPDTIQKMEQNTTENAEAHEAYLRGRFLWSQETHQSLEEAVTEFQKAVRLDPKYALAYVGLADTYNVLGGYGFIAPEQAWPKGKAAAAKALDLAPNSSDAYGTMAFAAFYYDWNWSETEDLFRKALSINPNNQVAHEFYASYLHAMGRLDEADKQIRIAQDLDPLSGWVRDDKGWILLSRHRPEEAAAEFQKAIELNPRFPAAHLSLAVAYLRMKQYDKGLQEVAEAERLGGSPTRVLEVRGSIQALSGDTAGAEATAETLKSGKISGRMSPYSVALIYTALGRKSEALDWLDKAFQEKDTWTVWTKILVEWDSLRDEPRFKELQRKLNL